MECDDAFFFKKKRRRRMVFLVSALEKFLSGRNEDVFLHGERREEKKGDLSFSFPFSEGRKKGMLRRFWRRKKEK